MAYRFNKRRRSRGRRGRRRGFAGKRRSVRALRIGYRF